MNRNIFFCKFLIGCFFVFFSTILWGQTTIAVQDFESSPATPTWTYTNTGGAVSTTNSGTPNNQRIRNGSRSFQVNNTASTITFGDVNVSSYNSVQIIVRLSSISTNTTNGADAADYVRLFTKLNSSSFATNTEASSDIAVNGNGNARWGYNTTGISTVSGTNVVVSGTAGTNQSTVYSTLTINIPNGTSTVGLRINLLNNDTTEVWCIDDVVIQGVLAGASLATGPTSLSGFNYIEGTGPSASQSFNLSGTNLSPASGSITINGSTNYEVSADNVSFGNNASVNYSSGTLSSTPIYVRLKSNLTATSSPYNSENITFSGGGVSSPPTVTCNGTVSPFVVNFAVTAASVNENGATYTIVVNSNAKTNKTVDVVATGGTATNGNQYSFSTTTATFTGSTSFSKNVTINNNLFCNGNTNVVFQLQNPSTGCTIGTNNQLDLTIVDDEITSGNFKTLKFETGDDWNYTGTGTVNTTTSKFYDTQSYRLGSSASLITDNIPIAGYYNVKLQVAFASVGADSGEDLFLDISYDNGTTWTGLGSVKLVDGYNNANINIGSTNASNPTTVATNPWVVNIASSETQIKVRVRTTTLDAGEYYWVDNIILSGDHCLSCSEPTTQANFYANSPTNITTTSATLTWTNGNGNNRIVVMRQGSPVTFVPTDNISYSANPSFGSGTDLGGGQFVVYNGNANTFDVSNLTAGTLYYATIFEYGCSAGSENYLTSGSPTTDSFLTNPNNPDTFTINCSTNNTATLSWNAPADGIFDGYLLTVRQGATPSAVNTIDPSSISGANSDFTLAANYGTSSKYLYKGTGNSVTVTGLTIGQSYTYKLYAFSDAGVIYQYSSGTQSTQTASLGNVSSLFAFPGNGDGSITWANPSSSCFDEVIAVVTAGSGITFSPSGDGSAYTANPTFSTFGQVVYKGNGNSVSITGLTNGITYYVEFFVRKGTEWSSGAEVAFTPSATAGVSFTAGDLAILSVNTALDTEGNDQISFVAFKDITEGTTFYITDNGYETRNPEKWGNTEGVISITRKNGTLQAGTLITIEGNVTFGNIKSASNYTVFTCGLNDDANWTKDAIVASGGGGFNLNGDDDMWILQGGVWNNGTAGNIGTLPSQDATYNGNVLYGWTESGWNLGVGNGRGDNTDSTTNRTKWSNIYPGMKCFTTVAPSGPGKVKFNLLDYIAETNNDQLDWIAKINTTLNWSTYNDNASFNAGGFDYKGNTGCPQMTIAADTHTNGKWNGVADKNWFNCSNWDTLKVPDANTDVSISSTATNNTEINTTAADSDLYTDIALARNLTIQSGKVLDMSVDPNAVLNVYGNWTNDSGEANYKEGGLVSFLGSSEQIINSNAHANPEVFNNFILGSNHNTATSNNIVTKGYFTLNNGKTLSIGANDYLKVNTNIANNGTITVASDGNLIQDTDGATFSGNNITVKRNLNLSSGRNEYNYISSPIVNYSLKGVYPGVTPTSTYPRVLYYNESNDYFYNSSGAYIAGRGLALKEPLAADASFSSVDLTFTGVPYNSPAGFLNYTLAYSNSAHGYNLVGNPYPSNIDLNKLYTASSNIESTFRFWDNKANNLYVQYGSAYAGFAYAIYNALTGNNGTGLPAPGYGAVSPGGTSDNGPMPPGTKVPNKIVKVGQGFMVRATGSDAKVVFKDSERDFNNAGAQFFQRNSSKLNREDDSYRLYFTTPGNLVVPVAVVYFDAGNNAFGLEDSALDASPTDSFFSYADSQKVLINGRATFVDTDKLNLGSSYKVAGTYNISLGNQQGVFANGQDIYLVDKVSKTVTNLQEGSYTFNSSTSGLEIGRFEIVYIPQSILGLDNAQKEGLLVYRQGDNFIVKSDKKIKSLELLDASGRIIRVSQPNKDEAVIQANHLPEGIYLLKIYDGTKNEVRKIRK